MTGPVKDRGYDAHQAAVKHLDNCDELADAWDADDLDGETADGQPVEEIVTAGPYCGCRDCEVREALAAMWPHALAHAADLLESGGVAPYTGAAEFLREEARKATLTGQEPPA